MADQEAESEERARQATEGMHDFEIDLAALRERFDEFESTAR
jgi:hypothetical protein